MSLIGPFPMATPPVRVGWFLVETDLGEACYWWDGEDWRTSDDPLDRYVRFDEHIIDDPRWYGQPEAAVTTVIAEESL